MASESKSPRTFGNYQKQWKKRKASATRSVTVALDRNGKIPLAMIPKALKPETKRNYNNAFWAAETLDDPATGASRYTFLANIGTGNSATTRVGDSIFVKALQIKYSIRMSAGATSCFYVLALIEDLEPAAGVPAWTDVFQGGAASVLAYINPILNYDKRPRFRLRRLIRKPLQNYYCGNAAGTVSSPQYDVGVINVKVNKVTKYDGAGLPTSGSEFILFGWSESGANTPQCEASYQTWFNDA